MRILIIDEDIFFQKFYITHLQQLGYQVDSASNGEEGFEKIKTFKPDLILLDLIMPEKDGFELLKLLSHDETLKNIPVLVFSTLGQEKEVEEAKSYGVRGYINKGTADFEAAKNTIASLLKT